MNNLDDRTRTIVEAVMIGRAGRNSAEMDEFRALARRNGYQAHPGGYLKDAAGRDYGHGWAAFAERVWVGTARFKTADQFDEAAFRADWDAAPPAARDHGAGRAAVADATRGAWASARAWLAEAITALAPTTEVDPEAGGLVVNGAPALPADPEAGEPDPRAVARASLPRGGNMSNLASYRPVEADRALADRVDTAVDTLGRLSPGLLSGEVRALLTAPRVDRRTWGLPADPAARRTPDAALSRAVKLDAAAYIRGVEDVVAAVNDDRTPYGDAVRAEVSRSEQGHLSAH